MAEPPAKKRRLSNDTAGGTSSDTVLSSLETAIPTSNAEVSVSRPDAAPSATELNDSAEKSMLTDEAGKPLSKNQQKKLKKKLEWESKRDDRKVLRKEKLLIKRERKKAAREADPEATAEAKRPERVIRKQLPVTIIIDCDFDSLMHNGERTSLASQITRCYSDNKNARYRAHMTISSFGGCLKERYDGILAGMYKNWRGVRFLETDFVDVAEKAKEWMAGEDGGVLAGAFAKYEETDLDKLKAEGETIYLSAEADETLEELKPFSTYIIGGLVDKNREKGLCHRRATQRGIKTARLPIGAYLEMSSRKVLTTNHVHEIMLKWLETGDWGQAFITVIPKRKGGQLKGVTTANGELEYYEDEHEDQDDEDEIAGHVDEPEAAPNDAAQEPADAPSHGPTSTS